MQTTGERLQTDQKRLMDAVEENPGVYEVMRLFAQYQKVLEQGRVYFMGHPGVVGFTSSDRTG